MYRVAFDPALPVVASSEFHAGGVRFAAGDSVSWRALGISEQTLLEWWLACLVSHPLETVTGASVPAPEGFVEVAFVKDPSKTVHVHPPRHGRRR